MLGPEPEILSDTKVNKCTCVARVGVSVRAGVKLIVRNALAGRSVSATVCQCIDGMSID